VLLWDDKEQALLRYLEKTSDLFAGRNSRAGRAAGKILYKLGILALKGI
jgi:hypothetical protein